MVQYMQFIAKARGPGDEDGGGGTRGGEGREVPGSEALTLPGPIHAR